MKVEFDYQLQPTEHACPFLERTYIETDWLPAVNHEIMREVFPHNRHQLKTWGNLSTSSCHFIAVQKQTPLHTDKGFPKFTHHLIMFCDDGFILRGLDKIEVEVKRGLYFVLDGHSPHQLLAKTKTAKYYLAVSLDSTKILPMDSVLSKMKEYLATTEITANLNVKNL